MDTLVLPTPKEVRDLLLDLLGRNVEVEVGALYGPPSSEPAAFAVYVDDRLATAAVVVADLELSAHMAAAIGLIPKGGAECAIEDRELSATLKENLHEVLNILASLLNAEGRPHVKLHATYPPGATAPSDVQSYGQVLGSRLDLSVSIQGYGRGRLSFVGLG